MNFLDFFPGDFAAAGLGFVSVDFAAGDLGGCGMNSQYSSLLSLSYCADLFIFVLFVVK